MNKKNNGTPKRLNEILDAAAELFAEKGFHGASTKDIADKLGIQQAGVYYYFKSKDSALAEVCRLGVAGYVENILAISDLAISSTEKVRRAIQEHLKPFHHIQNHVRVFQSERRYLEGENRAQVRKLEQKYEREMRRLFENGVASGEFRADLDCGLATLALLGMCNSVVIWYDGKSEKEIVKIAEQYAKIVIDGVSA